MLAECGEVIDRIGLDHEEVLAGQQFASSGQGVIDSGSEGDTAQLQGHV